MVAKWPQKWIIDYIWSGHDLDLSDLKILLVHIGPYVHQSCKFGEFGKECWKSVGKTNFNKYVCSGKVKEERCMLNTIWQRKHRWLGHLRRNQVLLREIIEKGRKWQSIPGKTKTTHVEWSCIISKVSGSKKGQQKIKKDKQLRTEQKCHKPAT